MRTFLISLILASAAAAGAQSHASPPTRADIAAAAASGRIIYTFDDPRLQPPHYVITIEQNGLGRFVSEAGAVPLHDNDDVYPAPLDRQIQLDPILLNRLFRYARTHSYFNENCERRHRRLAFTGNKTFTYVGRSRRGSCSFVWAADPELQHLSDRLIAVAYTLEMGRRLSVEMRYYPLSLDSELAALESAVANQQADDLPNIAPELQYIATNRNMMHQVRERALALLRRCKDQQKVN